MDYTRSQHAETAEAMLVQAAQEQSIVERVRENEAQFGTSRVFDRRRDEAIDRRDYLLAAALVHATLGVVNAS